MTDKMVLPERPEDKITITYAGESRELFMSFLRHNALLRVVEEPTRVMMIPVDPDLGELVLQVVLAPDLKKAMEFELDDTKISGEDVETILCWAQEHLTYFFMKRFQQVGAMATKLEPMARALQSSQPGSGG